MKRFEFFFVALFLGGSIFGWNLFFGAFDADKTLSSEIRLWMVGIGIVQALFCAFMAQECLRASAGLSSIFNHNKNLKA